MIAVKIIPTKKLFNGVSVIFSKMVSMCLFDNDPNPILITVIPNKNTAIRTANNEISSFTAITYFIVWTRTNKHECFLCSPSNHLTVQLFVVYNGNWIVRVTGCGSVRRCDSGVPEKRFLLFGVARGRVFSRTSMGLWREGNFMADTKVRKNESIDDALRRFKRSVAKDGTMAEVKKRRHYEKPSVKKKKKSEAARKKRHRF